MTPCFYKGFCNRRACLCGNSSTGQSRLSNSRFAANSSSLRLYFRRRSAAVRWRRNGVAGQLQFSLRRLAADSPTRHTVFPTSSAISNAPDLSTASSTGRPRALPSLLRKPVTTSSAFPFGWPLLRARTNSECGSLCRKLIGLGGFFLGVDNRFNEGGARRSKCGLNRLLDFRGLLAPEAARSACPSEGHEVDGR